MRIAASLRRLARSAPAMPMVSSAVRCSSASLSHTASPPLGISLSLACTCTASAHCQGLRSSSSALPACQPGQMQMSLIAMKASQMLWQLTALPHLAHSFLHEQHGKPAGVQMFYVGVTSLSATAICTN